MWKIIKVWLYWVLFVLLGVLLVYLVEHSEQLPGVKNPEVKGQTEVSEPNLAAGNLLQEGDVQHPISEVEETQWTPLELSPEPTMLKDKSTDKAGEEKVPPTQLDTLKRVEKINQTDKETSENHEN